MNITEYYKTIRASIEKWMPELSLQLERKPGGHTGIRISMEGEKASPLLPLDDYYDRYRDGQTLNETITDLIHDWKKAMSRIPDIRESDISDWEKARLKIFLTLTAENFCTSKDTVHRKWLGMQLTIRYCITCAHGTLQSFPVPEKLAERYWHVTEKELFQTAWSNTAILFPASLKKLTQIIADISGNHVEKAHTEASELFYENDPLPFDWYVLTNCHSLYGAAAISYKGLSDRLYRRFGKPFYAIPSSIHEMILYPEPEDTELKNKFCPEYIKEILFFVNRNNLEPNEYLSDSLYYYDGKELIITETGGSDDE